MQNYIDISISYFKSHFVVYFNMKIFKGNPVGHFDF